MELAVFLVAAAFVLVGALGVVLSRNPVHSALMLVLTLFGIAVLFVQLEAGFLAAVQVIVYAGAIVVLFLFVIMLLGVDRIEGLARDPLVAQRPAAVVVMGAVVAGILVGVDAFSSSQGAPSMTGSLSGAGSNVEKLAEVIFTRQLFAFEATSALLVIAVVGAVVLSRRGDADSVDDGAVGDDGDQAVPPAPRGVR